MNLTMIYFPMSKYQGEKCPLLFQQMAHVIMRNQWCHERCWWTSNWIRQKCQCEVEIYFPIYKRENIFELYGNHSHHSKKIGILKNVNEIDKREKMMKFYKAIKRQPLPQQFLHDKKSTSTIFRAKKSI